MTSSRLSCCRPSGCRVFLYAQSIPPAPRQVQLKGGFGHQVWPSPIGDTPGPCSSAARCLIAQSADSVVQSPLSPDTNVPVSPPHPKQGSMSRFFLNLHYSHPIPQRRPALTSALHGGRAYHPGPPRSRASNLLFGTHTSSALATDPWLAQPSMG